MTGAKSEGVQPDARDSLLNRLLDPADPAAVVDQRSPSVPVAHTTDDAPETENEYWDDSPAGAAHRSQAIQGRAQTATSSVISRLRGTPLRAFRDGLALLGLGYAAFLFLVIAPADRGVGSDAFAYWSFPPSDPYRIPRGALGGFPYSPAIAQLFEPFRNLPWDAFLVLWLGVLVATVIWLGWSRTLLVLAFPPVAIELYHGNINLLIAAAIALGFRYPATWAFVLLTKVTPGVGLLWFLVRREWRSLAIAMGVTAVVVVGSYVLEPKLWTAWLQALVTYSGSDVGGPLGISIFIRLPVAAATVLWGARTDRAWTVPVAATLAMPTLFIAVFSALAALGAMYRPELRPLPRRRA